MTGEILSKSGELVVQDDAHKELETYLSLSLSLSH